MRIPEDFWRPLFLRALSKSHEEAREFYVEMCNLGLATTLTYQQLKYEAKLFFKQRIGEVDTLSKLIKAKQTEEESLDQWYSRIFKLMIIAVDCSEHAWNDIHPRDGLLSIAKRRLVAGLKNAELKLFGSLKEFHSENLRGVLQELKRMEIQIEKIKQEILKSCHVTS